MPVPRPLLASVCGPDKPETEDLTVGHIVGHRDETRRELYGPGDILVVDVGADMGLKQGDNYIVRRRSSSTGTRAFRSKQATLRRAVRRARAGGGNRARHLRGHRGLRVCRVHGRRRPGPVRAAAGADGPRRPGEPFFDEPAHIVFGELGRATGATNQLMVIDRGYSQGVVRGQRFTLFRHSVASGGPVIRVGDGVVVAVRPQSATIRIDRANDAVEVGALVALHR